MPEHGLCCRVQYYEEEVSRYEYLLGLGSLRLFFASNETLVKKADEGVFAPCTDFL